MRNSDPFDELLRSLEENLRGSSEQPPEDRPVRTITPPNWRRWLWVLIPLLLLYLAARAVGLLANYTWIASVGYESVFWVRLGVMVGLFAGGSLLFFLFYLGNVILARQLAPWGLTDSPLQQVLAAFGLRVMPVVMLAGAAAAIFMGVVALGRWEEVLLLLRRQPFGMVDPLFGRDVGFFVFVLPVWEALQGWLLIMLAITACAVVLVSGVYWLGWRRNRAVLIHLGVLAALILLIFAWQYQVRAYSLVYSQRGAVYGAGFADASATLPALRLMAWATVGVAIVVIVLAALRRNVATILALLAVWFAVGFAVTSVYPGLVQRFRVRPNELNLESPYIVNNINFTRIAYALDRVDVQPYDAGQILTGAALLQEPNTLLNMRLWDYRPLLQTYNQVQALRQYYEFNDIDIDRYPIDGKPTQVMLGARELIHDRLSEDARTWVNQRLVYTHGFGVAASPVSKVTHDGLPTFLLKDLPPEGMIDVTEPRIYFGERTDDYVIGRTARPEFDFPRQDGNVFTSFSAETGIRMTWWNRILFALHLADLNLILNKDISSDSRLLWHRDIVERAERIAPFLIFDGDPYIVVGDDGRLYWMQDAYTATDRFPYSQPLGGVNYIRNAVKVVTDAYDGTVTFYVADADDALISAYVRAFPGLFRSLNEMPATLQDHIRYPQDLFTAQAEIYRTYHMTDPTEFYNREDMWAWPEEILEGSAARVDPNYVLMQLPGSEELNYMMILPFTPSNRENMVAWLAVQSDPEEYGEKIDYRFGKDSLFFGPKQIEARIDQDPAISAQLTLWNQQGSNVIRGNVLVFPIADSLLYVEPLYLQAQSGRIPELKRVIVATAENVSMGNNLGDALAQMFGGTVAANAAVRELGAGSAAGTTEAAAEGEPSEEVTLEGLIERANEIFAQAQARQREGDWAGYGESLDQLRQTLEQLAAMGGVDLPMATPAAPGDAATPAATPPATPAESAP